MKLSDQFDHVVRVTGSGNNDWDNLKLQEELKRMIKEEPRIPTYMMTIRSDSPNIVAIDI